MNDGYIELVIAIINQATKDYKSALRREKKKQKEKQKKKNQKALRDCESFFLSEWGQLLTHENGELIIQRCKKEVAEEKSRKKKKGVI